MKTEDGGRLTDVGRCESLALRMRCPCHPDWQRRTLQDCR